MSDHWTRVVIHLADGTELRRPPRDRRRALLREWAEGSRETVVRVTRAEDGRELPPVAVDWEGIGREPRRPTGHPRTGRGRDAPMIGVRVTPDEHNELTRAAERAGEALPAYVRQAALERARIKR